MRERPKELRLPKESMVIAIFFAFYEKYSLFQVPEEDSPTRVLETVLAQDKTKREDGQRLAYFERK